MGENSELVRGKEAVSIIGYAMEGLDDLGSGFYILLADRYVCCLGFCACQDLVEIFLIKLNMIAADKVCIVNGFLCGGIDDHKSRIHHCARKIQRIQIYTIAVKQRDKESIAPTQLVQNVIACFMICLHQT